MVYHCLANTSGDKKFNANVDVMVTKEFMSFYFPPPLTQFYSLNI